MWRRLCVLCVLCVVLLVGGCATLLQPKTESEKARALKFCVKTEWVMFYTDGIAHMACAVKPTTPEWAGACLGYQCASNLMKKYTEDIRLAVKADVPEAEVVATLDKAEALYPKIDEVYQGEFVE